MSRISRLLLVAVLLLAVACGSSGSESAAAGAEATTAPSPTAASSTAGPVAPGNDVPEALAFSGATLGGGTFEGPSVVGNDLLLWFWAPW